MKAIKNLFTLLVIFGGIAGMAAVSLADDPVLVHETLTFREEDRKIVSTKGIAILQNIREARQAIAKRNSLVARRRTSHALTLLNQARQGSPTLRLQDRIHAAIQRVNEDGTVNKSEDLMPIYAELDTVVYERDDEIRQHLAAAEKSADKNDPEELEEHLVSAVAEVGYTEIDLPMNEVARFLARARVDLHHHREQAADAELREAQDSVMIFVGHASIDVEGGSITAVSVGPRR